MTSRLLGFLGTGMLVAALAACGDSTTGTTGGEDVVATPSGVKLVETLVDSEVPLGAEIAVTCGAFDIAGEPVELADGVAFTVRVEPSETATVNGTTVVFDALGEYTVACALADMVDETPEPVTVVPGTPATVTTSLDPAETVAGEATTVTCEVQDAHGNVLDVAATVSAAPSEGVSVDGMAVTGTVAGDYEVTCAVDGATSSGAAWTVVPASPSDFALVFAPDKVVSPGQKVKITGEGADAYGNVLTDLAIGDVSVGVLDAFTWDGERLWLDVEGTFEVTGSWAGDAGVTATKTLVVDGFPPELTITWPPRGLTQGGDQVVTVTGTVSDSGGEVTKLEIAGQQVAVDPKGGAFEVDVDLVGGMNTITFETEDNHGRAHAEARTVLWAPSWLAMDPASFETDGVVDAISATISPEGIDDGVHDPAELNDLATLATVILGSFDLASMLDNPLATFGCFGGDCDLNIDSIVFEDPDVSLSTIDGGLHLLMTMNALAADIVLSIPCSIPIVCASDPLPLPGTMQADVVTLQMDLLVDLVDGALDATAENTVASIEGLTFDIENPIPGDSVNDLINGLVDPIEPILLGVLETVIPPVLEDQLAGALAGLVDSLGFDTTFELPSFAEGMPANELALETELTALDFDQFGMHIAMSGLASAATAVRPHDVLGAPTNGCEQLVPPAVTDAKVSLFMLGEFLNQLLFAVWDGGTLNFSLEGEAAANLADLSEFGVALSKISVDAMLQPHIDVCSLDQLALQLGDLFLDVEMDFFGTPTHIAFWLQAGAPVALVPSIVPEGEEDAGATQLGFELGDFDTFYMDVVTNAGFFEGDDDGLKGLVQDAMLPLLLEQLTDLAFTLPAIDLSSLSESIAEGTTLNIVVDDVSPSPPGIQVLGGFN